MARASSHSSLSERWASRVTFPRRAPRSILCFTSLIPRDTLARGTSGYNWLKFGKCYTESPRLLSSRRLTLTHTFHARSHGTRPQPQFDVIPTTKASLSESNADTTKSDGRVDYETACQQGITSSGLSVALVSDEVEEMPEVPTFDHFTLFHDKVEEYATRFTSLTSPDFLIISEETAKAGLYAPCMVGKLEGQFLKTIARLMKARRVLDIGTFTGFSALAFAEALPDDGEVVTLEGQDREAEVAQICFDRAKHGKKIKLVKCDARDEVDRLADAGEKFDIVFLDADKESYKRYYEAGIRMLNDDGVLMADNALCSLVYSHNDPRRQTLHEFAEFVRQDDRVEQVMLTVREGVLMVQKKQKLE